MTNTSRVSGLIADTNTIRVKTSGAGAATPGGTIDRWGGTWGDTWGLTWSTIGAAIPGTSTSPAIDVTARVAGEITVDQTERVSGSPSGGITSKIEPFKLLLEGDVQNNGDYLLLEGDEQSGDDVLKLEGDESRSITADHTKRVTGV